MYKAPSRLFAILSLSATAFASGVGSALLPGDLGNLGLFAEENLEIWERATVFADAIGAETLVSLRSHDQITSDIWAPGRISLLDHSHQIWGDIHYGALEEIAPGFNTQNGYRFPMQSGEWLPRALKAEPVRYGTADIWEGSGQRVDLAPGDYRDVEVRYPSSIRLSAGTYNFRKLKLTDYVAVTYDVTNGPIYVNVEEELELRQTVRNEFVPSVQPFSLRWRTNQTADVIFAGFDNIHYGVVTAPNAKVTIGQRVNFVGAIRAKSISVQPDGAVCVPPVLEDLRHSEVAMGPWFDSWTAEYVATVRTGVDTLHFEAKAPGGATVSFSDNDFAPSGTRTVVVTLTDPARSMELPGCAESRYRVDVRTDAEYQLFVNASSPCNGASCNGHSWERAFRSLDAGLDAAQREGKELWLASGIYEPSREYMPGDSETMSFYLGSGAELRGGFGGTESDFEERRTSPTDVVLRGKRTAPVIVVDGGAPTIERVTVENGYSGRKGGAITVNGGSPMLIESVIRSNYSISGGVVVLMGDDTKDTLRVERSYFYGNDVKSGGVLKIENGNDVIVVNSVLFGNSSLRGGGIVSGTGNAKLDYVTALDNGAQCIGLDGKLNLSNSVLWGGGCTISASEEVMAHNDLQGRAPSGSNISANPGFIDMEHPLGSDGIPGTLDDGLQPGTGSPLIDAGVDSSEVDVDIVGMDRPFDGDGDGVTATDIGAFEGINADGDLEVGHLVNGSFVPVAGAMVVLGLDYRYRAENYLKSEEEGLVFRAKVPRKDAKDIKSAYAEVTVRKANGDRFPGSEMFKVRFYRVNNSSPYYFVTKTATQGKSILLTDSRELQGEYESGTVFYAEKGCHLRFKIPHGQF